VYNTSELITIRARALERRDKDLEEARLYLRRIREKGKEYFDIRNRIRTKIFEPNILVLVYDTFGGINILSSTKLAFR
jgi:hypothetical protein